MKELLREARAACDHNMWYSAISLSLILPDICCKVEKGLNPIGETSGEDYKKWVKDHVHFEKKDLLRDFVDDDWLWSLRCRVLHTGSSFDIKMKNSDLLLEVYLPDNKEEQPFYFIHYKSFSKDHNRINHMLMVSAPSLCNCIIDAAEKFYDEWEKKEDFDMFSIKVREIDESEMKDILKVQES